MGGGGRGGVGGGGNDRGGGAGEGYREVLASIRRSLRPACHHERVIVCVQQFSLYASPAHNPATFWNRLIRKIMLNYATFCINQHVIPAYLINHAPFTEACIHQNRQPYFLYNSSNNQRHH